jgi:hypothetical protein
MASSVRSTGEGRARQGKGTVPPSSASPYPQVLSHLGRTGGFLNDVQWLMDGGRPRLAHPLGGHRDWRDGEGARTSVAPNVSGARSLPVPYVTAEDESQSTFSAGTSRASNGDLIPRMYSIMRRVLVLHPPQNRTRRPPGRSRGGRDEANRTHGMGRHGSVDPGRSGSEWDLGISGPDPAGSQ